MRKIVTYKGRSITAYAISLCDYGDRGDFEVFPDVPLGLDLRERKTKLNGEGFASDYADDDVVILIKNGVTFTLYPDGRLIIENLAPSDTREALTIAAGIVGYVND